MPNVVAGKARKSPLYWPGIKLAKRKTINNGSIRSNIPPSTSTGTTPIKKATSVMPWADVIQYALRGTITGYLCLATAAPNGKVSCPFPPILRFTIPKQVTSPTGTTARRKASPTRTNGGTPGIPPTVSSRYSPVLIVSRALPPRSYGIC
ncbi:hypothetical protein D3C81_894840 [compost metagenome]